MPAPQAMCMELLAPAGGPDALIAAVNNGADAVYLGLPELNARRGAANFDLDSLRDGARFAHLRGAKIYLTANVVVLPQEMSSALAMIDAAWAAGIDAVIVQDLGLLRVVRESLPDVRLHASTQISAMNPEAIDALAEAGVSRVTLARELSLPAIAACASRGVEVETFGHGALCYCYSGQCLMSSLIGRRSANRGLCAQPCRLSYDLVDAAGVSVPVPGRYLLSPKDLASIAHLPELAAAGVAALKIEGRMKSPEYVAIVTGVYRAALDRAMASPDGFEVLPAEWEMLEEAFSRGFTDGYLTGERGGDLMSYTRPNNRGVPTGRVVDASPGRASVELERALDPADTLEIWTRRGRFAQPAGQLTVAGARALVAPAGAVVEMAVSEPVAKGDRVFRVANEALLQAARRTFTGGVVEDVRALPVDFEVRVRVGEPLRLVASAANLSSTVAGSEVTAARTKPITVEEIIEHVGRLGGSGYRVGNWNIDLDASAGLGFSALHALRRQALDELDALRLASWEGRTLRSPAVPALDRRRRGNREGAPLVVASVWDRETAEACLSAGADRVLLRTFCLDVEDATHLPAGIVPLLPRVMWPDEMERYEPLLGAETVAGNLGWLHWAGRRGSTHADWGLNALNAHTAKALGDLGASLVWASPELSGRQLAELVAHSPVPVGCLVWGRVELMVAEQCVLQASGPCGRRCATCVRRRGWWHLRDQKGYEFPVTTDSTGRSHVMNSVPLDLSRGLDEVIAAGVDAVRLEFSDEPPARAAEITSAMRRAVAAVAAGGEPPAEALVSPATSGHFYRGLR